MSHLPTLIADLALILISASVITLLFKWMKQPLVLGYIIAGLLAGPYINIFPTVGDGKSSVSCPLKPSDSAPLKHSTMPP